MRTGKYAHIINNLPRLLRDDPERVEKLTAIKTSILSATEDGITWDEVETHLAIIQREYAVVTDLLLRAAGSRRYASAFARVYRWLRIVKDLFSEQEKDIQLLLDANSALLIDQYEVEDATNVKLSTGDSVRVQPEPYAKVVDRDLLRNWARKNGLERNLSLPWQTTNAITKERLLKGQPEPDGVIAHALFKVVWTK